MSMDFEQIHPTPKELLELPCKTTAAVQKKMIAKYGHKNWYDWRVENWGTKWPISDDGNSKKITRVNPTKIKAKIVTAWDFPFGLFIRMSVRYPDITIKMIDCKEESGSIMRLATIQNGKVIQDNIPEHAKNAYEPI